MGPGSSMSSHPIGGERSWAPCSTCEGRKGKKEYLLIFSLRPVYVKVANESDHTKGSAHRNYTVTNVSVQEGNGEQQKTTILVALSSYLYLSVSMNRLRVRYWLLLCLQLLRLPYNMCCKRHVCSGTKILNINYGEGWGIVDFSTSCAFSVEVAIPW
jgi:hypothetical protein